MFSKRAPVLAELTTTLEQIVKDGNRTFLYIYDFGDNWEHKVSIEKTLPAKAKTPADPMPQLIDGEGPCPMEDCGGIWGWHDILHGDADFLCELEPEEIERIKKEKFDLKQVKFR